MYEKSLNILKYFVEISHQTELGRFQNGIIPTD